MKFIQREWVQINFYSGFHVRNSGPLHTVTFDSLHHYGEIFSQTRFRPVAVKALIHDVLNEELTGKQYSSEECITWTKTLSEAIKSRVKGLSIMS